MTDKNHAPPQPTGPINAPTSSGRAMVDPAAREAGKRNEAASAPLEFGPDGEIEFKDAVPRQRDAVLRILREEAEHAAAEENRALDPKAQMHAEKIDGAQIERAERSQSIVRTGKSRISDSGGIQKPATTSDGRLRSLALVLVAVLAIAAFAYRFAIEIGSWAPWLKPYLAQYVHAADRLVAWLAETF